MNFPNFGFWSHLVTTLAVEVCVLAILALPAQRAIRQADWQRTIWQMTLVCILLVTASEWFGFGRGMAVYFMDQKLVVANASPPVIHTLKTEEGFPFPTTISNQPLALPTTAVWWPGWIWLAGTVLVLGRLAVGQSLLLALQLRRKCIVSDSLEERVLRVAKSIGMRRRVRLLQLAESTSPIAFGILRPSIGLPVGFESRFNDAEQESILAHELAHLAAMDPMWFLVADISSALLWWNPLAWWVRRSLHITSELAADEATALVPDGPGSLAKCLVALGKEMTSGHRWGWVGIGGGFRSNLGKRVERLTRMPSGVNRPRRRWFGATTKVVVTILVVPAAVVLCGAFQSTQGQSQDSLRGEIRNSWNNSPGAVLILAASAEKQIEEIDARLQDAKLYYEMGKLNKAERILAGVLRDSPSNPVARYYLALIRQARGMDKSPGKNPKPIPLATNNPPYASEDLSPIQKPPVATLVQDAKLYFEMGKLDESQAILNEALKEDPSNGTAQYYLDLIKEARYVDKPRTAAVILYSKVFHVDPSTFVQNLRSMFPSKSAVDKPAATKGNEFDDGARSPRDGHDDFGGPAAPKVQYNYVTKTNDTLQLDALVRTFFTTAGVDLTEPGKSVFFNYRLGLLLVRASSHDLEVIQDALGIFNQMPPQVMIMARYANVDKALLKSLMPDIADSSEVITRIMTEDQLRSVITQIEQAGDDVLIAAKAPTLSGRLLHLNSSGLALDVLANVGPDGLLINATAVLTVKSGNTNWQWPIVSFRDVTDGATIAVAITTHPPSPQPVRMVFITPRIIDPAGNPVHTDAELSGKH